jgi:Zn-dependent protease
MSALDLLLERAAVFIPLLLSLTVHEWAHAWAAWRLGDDTAKMLGRVSLNPVDHIDPVGTVLLPLLGVPFGWAKPVPINPMRFRANISMPLGVLLTAAAGPVSNLLLALAGGAAFVLVSLLGEPQGDIGSDPPVLAAAAEQLQFLILINLLLAFFNLLPIPPLDGSRIVDAVVPAGLRPLWSRFSSLGPLLLAALILLPGLVGLSLLAWPLHRVQELLAWVASW